MKRLKKVFLLLLCVSLVLSAVSIFSLAETELTEYGYYSVDKWYMDYPICRRFYNTFNHDGDFHYWYMSDYRNWQHNDTLLNFMSSLWLKYYCVGDPEVICDDYINKFEVDLVNAYSDRPPYTSSSGTQLYGFAVDNYSWENNTLTACCTMDYDITERRYFDDEYGMYYSETVGNLNAYVCLGFTNKSDGKLVNLAKIEDFVIAPEYEYHDSLIGKYHYTYSFSDTFTVEMPSFYDPLKHDVTLYFYAFDTEYYWDSLPLGDGFYNPTPLTRDDIVEPPAPEVVRGDADGDGVLNLADVTATMKYLAEWKDVVIDETAADTDGNGSVNLTDVSFMLQLIAGWNV